MKTKLIIISIAVLCMVATPARADLFDITISNPNSIFDGSSTFTSDASSAIANIQIGNVIGQSPPALGTAAVFVWPADLGSFSLTMQVTNIGVASADGLGSFVFTDIDGDTITADLTGTWAVLGASNDFSGVLGNVAYNPSSIGETTFDGGTGSVPMNFSAPLPWNGSIVHLTASAPWFGNAQGVNLDPMGFDVTGGSIDITIIPVPGAVLLGILGLSAAGLKLRKFA